MVHQADYVVPVEIENQYHNVYVIKRPGVDGTSFPSFSSVQDLTNGDADFLKAMGEIYEVVIDRKSVV